MKRLTFLITLILLMVCFAGLSEIMAQCPMCRMSAESNLQHGGTMGKGLNNGILYILSLPYLLVLTLGIVWYRNKKKEDLEKEYDVSDFSN